MEWEKKEKRVWERGFEKSYYKYKTITVTRSIIIMVLGIDVKSLTLHTHKIGVSQRSQKSKVRQCQLIYDWCLEHAFKWDNSWKDLFKQHEKTCMRSTDEYIEIEHRPKLAAISRKWNRNGSKISGLTEKLFQMYQSPRLSQKIRGGNTKNRYWSWYLIIQETLKCVLGKVLSMLKQNGNPSYMPFDKECSTIDVL